MALGALEDHSVHLQRTLDRRGRDRGGLYFTCLKDNHWDRI